MEDNIELFEKDKNNINKEKEKERENLNYENLLPLNNKIGRNKLIIKSFHIVDKVKKEPLKKSSSSILPSINTNISLNKNNTINNNNNIINDEFNSTNKTNSLNISLFNKDIKFTTLNENNLNILSYNNKVKNYINQNKYNTIIDINKDNNRYPLLNNINSQQKLLSKNFQNLINSNDFVPNLGKYDKKIIISLNQKCKELENKYLKALKYYYQMENIYINEEMKKKDSEIKLNNSIKESNLLKNKYERMKQDNIHLNNALVNTRNEIDRLNIVIKKDQKDMIKQQDEYNKQLKIEENKRTKLRGVIKMNERQISILEEKINDNGLSHSMKMKKYNQKKKLGNRYFDDIDDENQKDEEIKKLKYTILDLQNQVLDLEKNLNKNRENKRELLDTIKLKKKQEKFNEDNINILFDTIEKQQKDGLIDLNLIKSKNSIIKSLKEKEDGINNIPHYCLPKNIKIKHINK